MTRRSGPVAWIAGMTTPDLGPAELIMLVFPGERADPGVAEVLAELAAGRDIRLLDLVFVSRTSGDLVRVTGAREDLDDIGLGALGVSTPKLISENDLGQLPGAPAQHHHASGIPDRSGQAARPAVRDAGGMVM